MIFICSPNNPTGNMIPWSEIEQLLNKFNGLLVIDEAYIDFSRSPGYLDKIKDHANLVLLQTLSKAWGLAALRIGLAFAPEEIIRLFNKIKSPYNISSVSQDLALKALKDSKQVLMEVQEIIKERKRMTSELNALSFVNKVYESEGNFVLVKMQEPGGVYNYLLGNGIVIRDRSRIQLCEGCLRFTIGTKEENRQVLELLKKMK
jgi:histidinol-phosphate aminotransferase